MNWFRGTFSARFIVLTLLVLLSIQSISFVVVEETVGRYVKQEIEESIKVSQRVWQNLLEQNHQRLEDGARVLAADFGFRSAVASRNEPTIASALINNAERIGASVAILVDFQWNIKASSLPSSQTKRDLAQFVDALSIIKNTQQYEYQIALFNGQPTQFIAVPVRAPRVIGYVLMGFTIGQEFLQEASELTGIELSLLTRPTQSPARVIASDEAIKDFFQQAMGAQYFVNKDIFDAQIGQQTFVTHLYGEDVVGGDISVAYMRSRMDASARFEGLFNLYLTITVLGSLVFALAITWLSRRITYPLEALTQATQALELGDYDVDISGTTRKDEVGTLARSFETMRASIKEQSETISRLAYFDPLTSLPNRFNFRRLLLQLIQAQEHDCISVLTINLNRFKQVNDVLGYEVGDRILKATALRVLNTSGVGLEHVARVSGDEFTLLLCEDAKQASGLARQIMQALQQPLVIEDTPVDISAAIGVATWPIDASGCDSLMTASQVAMYAAKTRTQEVASYHPEMVTATPESLSLLSQLRDAIEHHELCLYFQPKVSTCNHQVVATEALIRWLHPEQGLIPPVKFIPFAEQTGFIRELTKWVITTIAGQWHALQTEHQAVRVSVNLSVSDLMDPSFPAFLQQTLANHQVPTSGICLEITESAIMDDPKFAEQTLSLLAKMGFRLSIDDFGTGYSSLGYLKRLPVHELKVDQSFVFGMVDNKNDYVIVQSTIELAHNLGLSVVAEGVESEAMLVALQALDCEEAQGYFIGKPMPLEVFLQWRTEWDKARLHDS